MGGEITAGYEAYFGRTFFGGVPEMISGQEEALAAQLANDCKSVETSYSERIGYGYSERDAFLMCDGKIIASAHGSTKDWWRTKKAAVKFGDTFESGSFDMYLRKYGFGSRTLHLSSPSSRTFLESYTWEKRQ